MTPLVTVCCITYNHAKYIRQAIEGFISQNTTFPYEVIIHDDASIDDTQMIIKEYEKRHPEILKAVLQKENQYSKGVKIIRDLLLPMARGKYIALCEGDDYWIDNNKLQYQIEYMEKNPDCSLTMHAAKKVTEDNHFVSYIRPFNQDHIYSVKEIIHLGNILPTASMVFRKDLYKSMPYFFTNAPVGDTPLKLFFVASGEVYYINKVFSAYRCNAVGSWTQRMSKNMAMREKHKMLMQVFFEEYNKYTNFQYKDTIKLELRTREFSFLVSAYRYKEAKKNYPDIFNNTPFLLRQGMNCAIYFPCLNKMLLKIKRAIIKR